MSSWSVFWLCANWFACGHSVGVGAWWLAGLNGGVAVLLWIVVMPAGGTVLVPREPTPEMLGALVDGVAAPWRAGAKAEFYGTDANMRENYRAMLAAAPKP